MSSIDIFRDLANALNKSINGARKLNNNPSNLESIAAYAAEVSAFTNAASAAVNVLIKGEEHEYKQINTDPFCAVRAINDTDPIFRHFPNRGRVNGLYL